MQRPRKRLFAGSALTFAALCTSLYSCIVLVLKLYNTRMSMSSIACRFARDRNFNWFCGTLFYLVYSGGRRKTGRHGPRQTNLSTFTPCGQDSNGATYASSVLAAAIAFF